MKKIISVLIVTILMICAFVYPNNIVNIEAAIDSESANEVFETSSTDFSFTTVDENGDVLPFDVAVTTADSEASESVENRALVTLGVLNFNSKDVTQYITEYTDITGKAGYINGGYGVDAAFLGIENGKAKFMIAGVIGFVNPTDKNGFSNYEILDSTNTNLVKSLSYYYVTNGKIYHKLAKDIKADNSYQTVSGLITGSKPSYLNENVKYYSYDGHYFYTDYSRMLTDYKNNSRTNSVNANTPFYNYYQYLSHRSTTGVSSSEINSFISTRTDSSSKMLSLGNSLINNQDLYGSNALLMMSVAANESAWGTSEYAQKRNNLFGHKAYDSNPNQADYYETPNESVRSHAKLYISEGMLDPCDGRDTGGNGFNSSICLLGRYNGPHLGDKSSGINVKYASDPYWGEKAAGIIWAMPNITSDAEVNDLAIKSDISSIDVKKEPQANSTTLYNTGTNMQYPFVVLESVYGETVNGSNVWYKVQSDPTLDASRLIMTHDKGEYDFNNYFAYIPASKVNLVNKSTVDVNHSELSIDLPQENQIINTKQLSVKGWAVSSKKIQKIEVYIDEELVIAEASRSYRQDVIDYIGSKYGGVENNPLPAYNGDIDITNFKSGKHTAKIVVKDNNNNELISKSVQFEKKEKYKSILSIDHPKQGEEGIDRLEVSGWFASEDLKKNIEIEVDGKKTTETVTFYRRDDVINFIGNEYGGEKNNPNPAYKLSLDISKLSNGPHTVKVSLLGSDNAVLKSETRQFSKTKIEYKGILAIDKPQENSEYNAGVQLTVSGWEVSNIKDAKVKVYIDGTLKIDGATRTVRQDATNISGEYGGASLNGTAGYTANVSLAGYGPGAHTVKVVSTDASGAEIASQTKTIKIVGYKGILAIDKPQENSEYNAGVQLTVSGWEVSNIKDAKVKVYIDGTLKIDGATRTVRQDATNISGEYGGASLNGTAGYTANVSLAGYGPGAHTVKVVSTDASGAEIASQTKTIKIVGYKGILAIDKPQENSEYNAGVQLTVSGWEVSNIKDAKVKVYIDGTLKIDGATRTVRQDATNISGEYGGASLNGTAGYTANVSLAGYGPGAHTVKVVSTDASGAEIASQTKTIKIVGYKGILAIDKPQENSEYNAGVQLTVSGWEVSNIKDAKVKVYIDGTLKIDGATRTVRQDATNISGEYGGASLNGTAGYTANVSLAGYGPGAHTVKVVSTDASGAEIASQTKTIKIVGYKGILAIDKPQENSEYNAGVQLTVSGWEVSNIKDAKVKVYIDGTLKIDGATRTVRQDATNISGEYGGASLNGTAGYTANVSLAGYGPGAHTVKVVSTDASGAEIASQTKTIKIVGYKGILAIDKPQENSEYNAGVQLTVSGWEVSNIKDAKVKVYIDGTLKIDGATRTVRQDATNISGEYGGASLNGTAGYTANVSLAGYGPGAHTVKVVSTDASGAEIASQTKTIKIVGYKGLLAVDNPENRTIISQNDLGDIEISGWEISNTKNSRIAIKVNDIVAVNSSERHVRQDATNISGEYGGANLNATAGYRSIIDKKYLSKNENVIVTQSFDEFGNKITEQKVNYYVTNYKSKLSVDYIKDGDIFNGTLSVSGWVVSDFLSEKIQILIDNKVEVDGAARAYRQDVHDFLNENDYKYGGIENNPLPAYSAKIDLTKLSVGSHTLTIRVLGDNQLITEQSITIIRSNPSTGWTYINGQKYFYNDRGQLIGNGPSKKIIDVSQHQGQIDWNTVKSKGDIDGVILRVGYGSYSEDIRLAYNLSELRRLGIPYGIYLYSYSSNVDHANQEAEFVASLIRKYSMYDMSYPIFYDIENFDPYVSGGVTMRPPGTVGEYENIILKFISNLNSKGFNNVRVYSYTNYIKTRLNSPKILPYVSWIAEYNYNLNFNNNYYSGSFGWQYSSSGSVPGISGNVDMNCWYTK